MRTVYKYPILVVDEQEIPLPAGADILTVQMQEGQPCLWALVRTDRPTIPRKIKICGTGHNASGVGRYIATFQMKGGALIFTPLRGEVFWDSF